MVVYEKHFILTMRGEKGDGDATVTVIGPHELTQDDIEAIWEAYHLLEAKAQHASHSGTKAAYGQACSKLADLVKKLTRGASQ